MTAPTRSVFVVPPATANGPLHVGHLSGPYLAADMAARAARARGEQVLAVAGFDANQNWILVRALKEGIDATKLTESFRDEIVTAYERARIGYDVFVDPLGEQYRSGVARLAADLVADGSTPMREITLLACADCERTLHHAYVGGACPRCGEGAAGGGCEGCGGYTCAENLLDPRCLVCGGEPVQKRVTVPVLDMEDHREYLTAQWQRADLPARARQIVAHYLEHGLPSFPLAYPSDWGPEGIDDVQGLRLDVYYDVALGLVQGVAAAHRDELTGTAPAGSAAPMGIDATRQTMSGTQIWHFNGIDNGFYFTLFWPVIYHLCGAATAGAVTNEFYTLDGAKFSTSRNHAIWANDILESEDTDIVRLFLAWDRPDRYASDFTMAAYREFDAYARPLLDGTGTRAALPAPLLTSELRRGLAALDPAHFDPALASRCLLSALANGSADAAPLRSALTGR